MRILLQGDSITDCGRDRNDLGGLGGGYAAIVANELQNHEFLNRGISGNRVYDLEARWDVDCLELKPDIVSILIGINDTWRRYDSNVPSPIDEFEASLDRICGQVVATGASLVLLEPFVLPIPKDRVKWREDLDPRIQTVRNVARTHKAILVPLDGIFAAASCSQPLEALAGDGVHPSEAGHRLIADALVGALRPLLT